jgi:hypothetical protein
MVLVLGGDPDLRHTEPCCGFFRSELHSPGRRQFSGSLLQDVGVIERPRLAAFITDCVVCYLVTRLHGVTLQNCVIFMVTTMRVAYHTHYTSFLLCSVVMLLHLFRS